MGRIITFMNHVITRNQLQKYLRSTTMVRNKPFIVRQQLIKMQNFGIQKTHQLIELHKILGLKSSNHFVIYFLTRIVSNYLQVQMTINLQQIILSKNIFLYSVWVRLSISRTKINIFENTVPKTVILVCPASALFQ